MTSYNLNYCEQPDISCETDVHDQLSYELGVDDQMLKKLDFAEAVKDQLDECYTTTESDISGIRTMKQT
ncbi:hypothetical protein J6590_042719 [Homalodisca vitripennis]|nr:hypothetical protein J6590_042719 [Homalodisca vitripennis]